MKPVKWTRAQVEWNLYVRNKDNQTQHAAAELALSWGWYAKASQSAGWSGRYDLIHLRYPNAFNAIVSDQTNKLGATSLLGLRRYAPREPLRTHCGKPGWCAWSYAGYAGHRVSDSQKTQAALLG